MDQASLRRKSIWRKQAWCGGHYPCLQDVDKSNENNKNGAHDGHKSIENTSDDDSSNINNERRCFFGVSILDDTQKHRENIENVGKV